MRGGFADHDPARRRGRFHPLGHPHLDPDGGVAPGPGVDFAGDHLAGIQADPQPQVDAVAAVRLRRPARHLVLDVEGGPAGPKSVVLQRDRRAEHRHDAVAGELVDRAAIALTTAPSGRTPRTDLAQPLGSDGRREPSSAHVGEQHGHLLVLGAAALRL